ncbi:hypothetical protein E2C00_13360 [Streptomyces sp. WAC05374]|uniref:hypothetical protein n=1 Tax=unclassified Streptomyces TaxID=2593676 RepID=UPI000F9715F5|nr:hypothetical protein [Streptomyces sp. WAC05374]RST02064.1 hypothetical protein EF905_34995 [Streptomyces sp. WAC05374]TDF44730.1 hypothetical protein E2B92_15065 [Streptomyces sp. WAC05374]TDF55970.1 hypothetical protein E2C00_13360 [Streptomyces sp. WAC05374]TDF59857.1 hypothetical protein E2C02_04100 [Streptomyces sp. WAC05374]
MTRTRRATARIVATTAATATLALGGAATAQAAAADPLSGLTGSLGGGLLDSASGPLGSVTGPLGGATHLASAGGASGATQLATGLLAPLTALK